MKKLLLVTVIAIAGIGFPSCTRHTVVVTTPATGSMNAAVNGKSLNSTYCVGTPGGQVSIITASFGSNSEITFNLKTNNLSATTYNLDSSGADNNAQYSIGGVPVLSKSGILTIDSINPGVNYMGTFKFVCVDGTVVAGKFTATAVK